MQNYLVDFNSKGNSLGNDTEVAEPEAEGASSSGGGLKSAFVKFGGKVFSGIIVGVSTALITRKVIPPKTPVVLTWSEEQSRPWANAATKIADTVDQLRKSATATPEPVPVTATAEGN